ncbi:hypothetical protein COCVIDRAFT_111757 [Bipolaris victoriae FI3]|uniref:Uncharacterized protein n=1 Tax=Bipolaris victoriae (strain FI3) TaxID=930091 RepID=W7E8N2_BIPV3|nr:hypothetical protein COCVIDRAFT_111757 [Bipolaris victoriae FI3]
MVFELGFIAPSPVARREDLERKSHAWGEGGLARRVSVSEQEVHLVSLAQTGSDRWGATSSRLPSAQVASILS